MENLLFRYDSSDISETYNFLRFLCTIDFQLLDNTIHNFRIHIQFQLREASKDAVPVMHKRAGLPTVVRAATMVDISSLLPKYNDP